MIKSFKTKGLKDLFDTGRTKHINKAFHARILTRLDVIDQAVHVEDLNVPGFQFHALTGFKPRRYTIHVNGPWCLTFTFEDGDAKDIRFENYHQK